MNSTGDRHGKPNFTFPSDWNNDEKMNVMFAPFRDKGMYLKSWEQKMKFWTNLIIERCKACDEVIIDIKTLSHVFTRKGKIPNGLDTVLTEMERMGKLRRVSDYDSQNQAGWLAWGYNTFVKNPFMWSVNKLLQRSPDDGSGQYVVVEVLQSKGRQLLQQHHSHVECSMLDNVLEISTLKRKYGFMFSDDQTFNLVLRQLEKDRKILIFKTENNCTVVKFAEKNEAYVTPVRDIETKVFRIQQTNEMLEKEAEVLSITIEKYTEEAKMYVRKGLKSTAMSVLRKKKKTQALLDKKLATLDIFHGLIENIKNTVSEKMVIEAYEAATSSLKSYMKTNKLSVDRVDDVLDNLQEVTQDQEEIAATIGNFQPSSWDMTQDDFEAELDSILAEDSPVKPAQPVSPVKPAQSVSPSKPTNVNQSEDDLSSLEGRLRSLYQPETTLQLPDVPNFQLNPRNSERQEEPMILS
ncbi:charged multivesicular body protein 7-like [Liolophura sinensis]|uniref:charged multivesicular body protein 7-like n=1 Tax=Liolophura sinensis TaxID=3198878 RepID=UPI00315921B3